MKIQEKSVLLTLRYIMVHIHLNNKTLFIGKYTKYRKLYKHCVENGIPVKRRKDVRKC